MPSSGYDPRRAALHNRLLPFVNAQLNKRGYTSELLEVDGHMPDGRFVEGIGYWDLKTGGPHLMIEVNDINTWLKLQEREKTIVYIIHANVEDERAWLVDTLAAILKRRFGTEEYKSSGSGSPDLAWRFARGGIPFKEFFDYRGTR